jgi:hypothetical protein
MTQPFVDTFFATTLALALALTLGGCASGNTGQPTATEPGSTEEPTATEPAAPESTAPYDDAAADADCNACTATGGTWFPMQRECIDPSNHVPMVADIPSFAVCPGACDASNCGGCITRASCEAATCTFESAGPAFSCH